jgi:hypothetical protein
MNIYHRGNVFIGLVATVLIFSMVYFLFVPKVKDRFTKQQEIPSKLASDLSQQTNIPTPDLPKKEYDGVFSWTNKVDITENPFNSDSSDISSSFKFKERSIEQDINADLVKENSKKVNKFNIFEETPTGYAFPSQSGYLDGYSYLFDKGSLLLTIDNSGNQTDLLIKLIRIGAIDSTSKGNTTPILARVIYVKHNEKITLNDLDSGIYRIDWLDLSNGQAYQYKNFQLYQDNRFQYNRYFKFNQQPNKDLKTIPMSNFYPSH